MNATTSAGANVQYPHCSIVPAGRQAGRQAGRPGMQPVKVQVTLCSTLALPCECALLLISMQGRHNMCM